MGPNPTDAGDPKCMKCKKRMRMAQIRHRGGHQTRKHREANGHTDHAETDMQTHGLTTEIQIPNGTKQVKQIISLK